MSFNPNLDKSTYLSPGSTGAGTVMGVVDGPQFWLPIESSPSKKSKLITYILPSVIVLGFVYIVVYDGKMR